MASVFNLLRTCGLMYCVILSVLAIDDSGTKHWIMSFKVDSKKCDENNCKYLLSVSGGEFLGHYSWRLTPKEAFRGDKCNDILPSYELHEIETSQWYTKIEVSVPFGEEKIYFCLHQAEKTNSPFGGSWTHQGADLFLDPKNDVVSPREDEKSNIQRSSDNDIQSPIADNDLQSPRAKSNLQDIDSRLPDLSHDTDVNYKPGRPRLTREEGNHIEVLEDNQYVPLNNFNENLRKRREISDLNTGEGSHIEALESTQVKKNVRVKRINYALNKNNVLHVLENDKYENPRTKTIAIEQEDFFTRELFPSNQNAMKTTAMLSSDGRLRSKRDILREPTFKPLFIEDMPPTMKTIDTEHQLDAVKHDGAMIKIEGLRIEDSAKEPKIVDDGIPSVLADSSVTLRLFGVGLTTRTVIAFTHDALGYGQPCKFLVKGEYLAKKDSVTARSALFDITAPQLHNESKLYICAKNLRPGVTDPFADEDKYYHQGQEPWTALATHNSLLPLWVTLTLILCCLMFSALFSGLNLGLMSLDRTELKIISNTGTEQERKYARAIMPVRDHGNYLLCSILLGNVAVNSTFTILLDELTSGLFAVIFSTLSIVLLGEITPQAICSRHGLMVGAKSICVTKAVMALTAPLAFPVSKLLDYFLGEEIGSVYNRERLKELVKVTTDVNDLDRDEVNIISGALELRKKRVCDVMTKLEDVFMLPISSVLDFETMSEIVKSGYSRIPVYEHSRGNIVTVLFIKDLAFVDPDDNTPLRTLCHYYQNPCNFVFEDVTLDIMFKHFKDGHKGHMAFVHRINNEGEGDPFYETVGLVTLEDVIEEMIQSEIVDETDVFLDNRTKRRRNRPQNKLQDFTAFAERHENQRIHISPQLTLATFQFLSTSVDAFRPDIVSETVLRRLLQQDVIQYIKLKGKHKKDATTFVFQQGKPDVIQYIKLKGKHKKDATTFVFQQGKPVDYFVLLLEGRVEVTVGRENLVFEAGPFTYFGVQALTQNVGVAESPTPSAMGSLQNINMDAMLRHTFVPDYSVRAITELYYLTVKRSLYLAAKRASLMEKGVLSKGATNEQFDTEVDKLLQSVDEDLSVSGEHKTPSRQVSPNPLPASASPHTRSHFTAPMVQADRNGDPYRPPSDSEEHEKLLK